MAPHEEKRRYPRFPTELVTNLRRVPEEQADEGLRAAVKNLSLAGAFIEAESDFEVGDYVAFELVLEGKKREITAVVRWRQGLAPQGIGVEMSVSLRDQILGRSP